jgi:hypothetical protein
VSRRGGLEVVEKGSSRGGEERPRAGPGTFSLGFWQKPSRPYAPGLYSPSRTRPTLDFGLGFIVGSALRIGVDGFIWFNAIGNGALETVTAAMLAARVYPIPGNRLYLRAAWAGQACVILDDYCGGCSGPIADFMACLPLGPSAAAGRGLWLGPLVENGNPTSELGTANGADLHTPTFDGFPSKALPGVSGGRGTGTRGAAAGRDAVRLRKPSAGRTLTDEPQPTRQSQQGLPARGGETGTRLAAISPCTMASPVTARAQNADRRRRTGIGPPHPAPGCAHPPQSSRLLVEHGFGVRRIV